jgi:hypothetical protein
MGSFSSMFMDEGMRAAAAGFVGAPLPTMAAGLAANSPIFGARNLPFQPALSSANQVPVNRPIGITQLRLKFASDAVQFAAGLIRLEVFRTDATANYTTGGTALLAQRKKISGYSPIPATEFDLIVSAGGALTGGSQVVQGTALDSLLLSANVGALSPSGESVIWPEDAIPWVIEQNEGLIVRASVPGTGTWSGFIGFDFFRF